MADISDLLAEMSVSLYKWTQVMRKRNMEDKEFDFGRNLENLILKRYSSISSFAKEVSISPKTLQEWCGPGARFPSRPSYLQAMAKCLGVSLNELMFGTANKEEMLSAILEKAEIHSGLYEITIKKVSLRDE